MTEQEFQKSIDRVLTRLGMRWCFFAQVLASLEIRIDNSIPTLATDGTVLYYNTTFWDEELDNDTKITGQAHELLHVILEHMWRRGSRDHRMWNVACDFKVNQHLEEEGFTPIKGWLRDVQYDDMSEEQIYNDLEKKGKGEGSGKGYGVGKGEQASSGDGDDTGEGLHPDFDDLKEPKGSAKEQGEAREKIRSTVIKAFNTYKAQGASGGLATYLAERVTKVKEPWYDRLLRLMTKYTLSETNWRKVNRRELDRTGIVTADIGRMTLDHVVIVVDTSGSVGRATLDYFGGHINTIMGECLPKKVTIIYCDAAVNKVVEIEDNEPITLEVIGGGGTDFRPAFEYVESNGLNPDVLIYLTDTFGTYPRSAPDYETIWASIYAEDRCSYPPFGEFVFIDEQD